MTDVEPIVEGVPVGPGRGPEPEAELGPDRSAPARRRDDAPPPLSNLDYSVAFSPRNLAIGFAIVAGLVALAARRRRGRSEPTAFDEHG
jgi:hypothetical protein